MPVLGALLAVLGAAAPAAAPGLHMPAPSHVSDMQPRLRMRPLLHLHAAG